jgi:hypothetical protein
MISESFLFVDSYKRPLFSWLELRTASFLSFVHKTRNHYHNGCAVYLAELGLFLINRSSLILSLIILISIKLNSLESNISSRNRYGIFFY